MRPITAKYDGQCRRCGADLAAGAEVVHEKRVGVFCPGCAPTDPEEIRAYRQEALNRRADRLNDRATKREAEAGGLYQRDQHLWRDHAFLTQPGQFPLRTQAMRRRDKAHRLATEAEELRARAGRGQARVKGDAAARDAARREQVRAWLQVGMRVHDGIMGAATVVKINRKTARIRLDRTGTAPLTDLMFLRPLAE